MELTTRKGSDVFVPPGAYRRPCPESPGSFRPFPSKGRTFAYL